MSDSARSEHLSIGEVLALVQADFPDVTISKIRFLESQGLIAPERTGSGFRKFYDSDIERLRWILRQQGDHFLPLKVIKKMLEDGADPSAAVQTQPTLWSSADSEDRESREGDAADGGAASGGEGSGKAGFGAGESPGRDDRYRSPAHPAVVSSPQGRLSGRGGAIPAAPNATGSDVASEVVSESSSGDSTKSHNGSGGTAGTDAAPSVEGASGTGGAAVSHPESRSGQPSTRDSDPRVDTPRSERAAPAGDVPSGSKADHSSRSKDPQSGSRASSTAGKSTGGGSGVGPGDPEGREARQGSRGSSGDAGHGRTQPGRTGSIRGSGEGVIDEAQAAASSSRDAGTHRTLSTPADVVAALQEDPRPSKRRGTDSQSGSESNQTDRTAETVPHTDESMNAPSAEGSGQIRTPLTRSELCELCDIKGELLDALEQFGFVSSTSLGGAHVYDEDAVAVTRLAARYAELGVEPRHLRMYKISAEREAGMIEQLVVPLLKQRNPTARQNASDRSQELTSMGAELHSMFLGHQLRRILGN